MSRRLASPREPPSRPPKSRWTRRRCRYAGLRMSALTLHAPLGCLPRLPQSGHTHLTWLAVNAALPIPCRTSWRWNNARRQIATTRRWQPRDGAERSGGALMARQEATLKDAMLHVCRLHQPRPVAATLQPLSPEKQF